MNGVRLTLRVLAVLLAAGLLALGVVVTVEIVLAAFGQPAWVLPYAEVATTLREQTWDSVLARAAAAGLCLLGLLGLLLLLPALRRGKPTALPLTPQTEGVDTHVSRRGLQRTLSAAASRVDGVRQAKAKVGRRNVKVSTTTRLRDTSELPSQVDSAVRAELDALGLSRPLAVKVTTKRRT